jgi:nucleoside-diphosphate-sugar epimerase
VVTNKFEKIAVADLEQILTTIHSVWEQLRGKTVFVTGGTGFFGKWLLSSFVYANKKLQLNAKLIVLTRNKRLFLSRFKMYEQPEVVFLEGDITNFIYPDESLDFIIHAATEASAKLNAEQPINMFDTIVNGTKHILELARVKQVKAFLNISSGAVYGTQPTDITHISEDFCGAPNVFDPAAAYGEGKRVAEMLAAIYFRHYNVQIKTARCFAFAGPYLPVDAHYALGNFIANAAKGEAIKINGDGLPYRSYLYASDLTIWLWKILIDGSVNVAYNVGSDQQITINQLANKIVKLPGNGGSILLNATGNYKSRTSRYVPSIDKAKSELGLSVLVNIDAALKKTYDFYITNNL